MEKWPLILNTRAYFLLYKWRAKVIIITKSNNKSFPSKFGPKKSPGHKTGRGCKVKNS
jgi:hypothetical protein